MIIASNFKTNHTRKSTRVYIENLDAKLRELDTGDEIMVFPPASAWDHFDLGSKNLSIGAQNAYPTIRGSFTGDVGTEQLDEFEIKTILIGHSERRHLFGETPQMVRQKYDFFRKHDMTIVLCIGEPLAVRQEGFEATMTYLWEQLEEIDLSYEKLVIAYEPVWAIGTGLVAQSRQIGEVHTALRQKVAAPLLYGGSVSLCTLENILRTDNVDGVLVGTASWDVEEFFKMITMSKKINEGVSHGDEGEKGSHYRCGE